MTPDEMASLEKGDTYWTVYRLALVDVPQITKVEVVRATKKTIFWRTEFGGEVRTRRVDAARRMPVPATLHKLELARKIRRASTARGLVLEAIKKAWGVVTSADRSLSETSPEMTSALALLGRLEDAVSEPRDDLRARAREGAEEAARRLRDHCDWVEERVVELEHERDRIRGRLKEALRLLHLLDNQEARHPDVAAFLDAEEP